MSQKLVISEYDIPARKVETDELYNSEHYRELVKEANEKIREAQIHHAYAYLHAEDFVAL